MPRRKAHLVIQHIERMPRRILEEHPDVVREYVKGKRGVYALFKKARLYYVGLASNLRSRLKAHVRDRHAGAWDFFSMYLTETDEHLRELEALVLRITMPRGNRSKTKFARSEDLRRYFKRKIAEGQRAELDELFGSQKLRPYTRRGGGPARSKPSLSAFINKRTPIRWTHKSKVHKRLSRPMGRSGSWERSSILPRWLPPRLRTAP